MLASRPASESSQVVACCCFWRFGRPTFRCPRVLVLLNFQLEFFKNPTILGEIYRSVPLLSDTEVNQRDRQVNRQSTIVIMLAMNTVAAIGKCPADQ